MGIFESGCFFNRHVLRNWVCSNYTHSVYVEEKDLMLPFRMNVIKYVIQF